MSEYIELPTGLSAEEIDERLRAAVRREHVSRREQAHYLVELQRSRKYQTLGFPDVKSYATTRLSLTDAQVRDLLFVGNALRSLPLVDRAFGKGRINWSKARLLTRICIPETQVAWLKHSRRLTIRQMERELLQSQKGNAPGEGLRLPQLRYRLNIQLPLRTHELWERAMNLVEDRDGGISIPREVLHEVLAYYIEGNRESMSQSHSAHEPMKYAEQDPAAPTDEALRRAILERDGNRCCHCGSELSLQVHHVKMRSAGGETRWANLLSLCTNCHMLVHENLLVIAGSLAEGWIFLDRKGSDTHRSAQEIAGHEPSPLTFAPPAESRDSHARLCPRSIQFE